MITIIAAIGKNNALGKNNQLIWHLPADLKRFKKITTGNSIIMGRKTFESLGKPLPNRVNIIITRNPKYTTKNGIVVHSLKEAIKIAPKEKQIFIIGGAQIYKQALPIADKLDLTFVHKDFDADAFFPEINLSVWEEEKRENFKANEKNKYDYSFVSFKRRK